ncbi:MULTISPECIES: hypothetical protein [unclassified Spiroplasma]
MLSKDSSFSNNFIVIFDPLTTKIPVGVNLEWLSTLCSLVRFLQQYLVH